MLDFLRDLTKSDEEKRQEQLNAYLDDALTTRQRQQFEKTLANDLGLQAELEKLRLLKLDLHQLPRRPVPRNFTLDPALYQRPAPQPLFQLYPVLRTATILTAFFFILALSIELFLVGGTTMDEDITADSNTQIEEPLAEAADSGAEEAELAVEETSVEIVVPVEVETQVEVETETVEETVEEEAEETLEEEAFAEEEIASEPPPAEEEEIPSEPPPAEDGEIFEEEEMPSEEEAMDEPSTDDTSTTEAAGGSETSPTAETDTSSNTLPSPPSTATTMPPTPTMPPVPTMVPPTPTEPVPTPSPIPTAVPPTPTESALPRVADTAVPEERVMPTISPASSVPPPAIVSTAPASDLEADSNNTSNLNNEQPIFAPLSGLRQLQIGLGAAFLLLLVITIIIRQRVL